MTPVTNPQGRGWADALLNYLSSERDVVVGVCVWYRLFNVDSGNHGSLLPSRRPKSKPSAPMSSCWKPHCTAGQGQNLPGPVAGIRGRHAELIAGWGRRTGQLQGDRD